MSAAAPPSSAARGHLEEGEEDTKMFQSHVHDERY